MTIEWIPAYAGMTKRFMHKAVLFKKLPKNWVKCTACSWYCQIPPGQTGICSVRQNINGTLNLLVYGQAVSVNVDPMEKKPLFHFLPGEKILSMGTLGCNFGCEFCQNWDISQASKTLKLTLLKSQKLNLLGTELAKYGISASPSYLVDYAVKHNIPAIAYTYNEPSIFVEYAFDTAKLAHKRGLKNVFVSNGYESKETLEYMRPYLDAINIDLKAFSEDFYQKICKAKLAPVLENIKRVWQLGIWEEITTLIIPGENDGQEELNKIAQFIASVSRDIPWHVTRFHPDYKMTHKSETPKESLVKAYQIGKKAGLKYVYVGNVLNNKYESTYCSRCGKKLISRNWHEVEILNFKNGQCGNCGEKIKGVWN